MKLEKNEVRFLILSFLSWRIILFFFLFISLYLVTLQNNFIGGGVANYILKPYFWAWSNFDGEHYISIARYGYGLYEYAFFPLYPLLIRLFSFGGSAEAYNFSGILISNISFLLSLIGFYKLLRLDLKKEVTKTVVFLLLLFPTSYYFASVYTESLFFLFVVWSFYFARKEKWHWASLLAMLASSTRNIGIILLPALFFEYLKSKGWNIRKVGKDLIWLIIIPLGILFYVYYLNKTTGDPLAFVNSLSGFGEQRSTTPIILPQVFFRYLVRIIPNLDYSYFPVVFTTLMELLVGILYFLFGIILFFKVRFSYFIYFALSYLIPSLSGSFSSLPRYVLISFPVYILIGIYLNNKKAHIKFLVFGILFILLAISSMYFFRGYWVS